MIIRVLTSRAWNDLQESSKTKMQTKQPPDYIHSGMFFSSLFGFMIFPFLNNLCSSSGSSKPAVGATSTAETIGKLRSLRFIKSFPKVSPLP